MKEIESTSKNTIFTSHIYICYDVCILGFLWYDIYIWCMKYLGIWYSMCHVYQWMHGWTRTNESQQQHEKIVGTKTKASANIHAYTYIDHTIIYKHTHTFIILLIHGHLIFFVRIIVILLLLYYSYVPTYIFIYRICPNFMTVIRVHVLTVLISQAHISHWLGGCFDCMYLCTQLTHDVCRQLFYQYSIFSVSSLVTNLKNIIPNELVVCRGIRALWNIYILSMRRGTYSYMHYAKKNKHILFLLEATFIQANMILKQNK